MSLRTVLHGFMPCSFLCYENHWLGQWFQKAYGDEENKKAPCYNQSAVWQLHEENSKEVIL